MKLSLNWLNSYFPETKTKDQPDWDEILHKLTMAGIEVESVIEVSDDIASLNDRVIELKITPNRGDCLSVHGILREIAALTDNKINLPSQQIVPSQDTA